MKDNFSLTRWVVVGVAIAIAAALSLAVVAQQGSGTLRGLLPALGSIDPFEVDFTDASHQGTSSRVRCSVGSDYTMGERLIVSDENGAELGSYPFTFTEGSESLMQDGVGGFCNYSAQVEGLPAGHSSYRFSIYPDSLRLAACSEDQLDRVVIEYDVYRKRGMCHSEDRSRVWFENGHRQIR